MKSVIFLAVLAFSSNSLAYQCESYDGSMDFELELSEQEATFRFNRIDYKGQFSLPQVKSLKLSRDFGGHADYLRYEGYATRTQGVSLSVLKSASGAEQFRASLSISADWTDTMATANDIFCFKH